jgi:hypothetical protein
MPVIYSLIGFSQYIIIDKIMYRKPYKIQMKNGNWQFRAQREIERIENNGSLGYKLIKDNQTKVKFYSLKSLKHRVKKNAP